MKTIAQGRPGDRHTCRPPRARFLSTRGTSGASRRPAFPAPLLLTRAEEDSKARAKPAARMSSHVYRLSQKNRSRAPDAAQRAASSRRGALHSRGPCIKERCSASGTRDRRTMAARSLPHSATTSLRRFAVKRHSASRYAFSSSARRSLRMMTPRARSSAAAPTLSLMSSMSSDISLCQSRRVTASGASRRR
ncbi:hypothetical protein SAMN05216573_106227 [Bradyrhizobium sp. Rc3b]|nr:hypothetical protein SAMN05216573_106227 [Bradyrhizobium sp. Rc3b]